MNDKDRIACRVCGNWSKRSSFGTSVDSRQFCGRCGLPLLVETGSSIIAALGKRFGEVLMNVPRFVLTSLLLLFRPVQFFSELSVAGRGTYGIRLFRGVNSTADFQNWRRSTSAVNFICIAVLVATSVGIVEENVHQRLIGMSESVMPRVILEYVGHTIVNFMVELLVVSILLSFALPYRKGLGIDESPTYADYFLYVVGQCVLISALVGGCVAEFWELSNFRDFPVLGSSRV